MGESLSGRGVDFLDVHTEYVLSKKKLNFAKECATDDLQLDMLLEGRPLRGKLSDTRE